MGVISVAFISVLILGIMATSVVWLLSRLRMLTQVENMRLRMLEMCGEHRVIAARIVRRLLDNKAASTEAKVYVERLSHLLFSDKWLIGVAREALEQDTARRISKKDFVAELTEKYGKESAEAVYRLLYELALVALTADPKVEKRDTYVPELARRRMAIAEQKPSRRSRTVIRLAHEIYNEQSTLPMAA